jgi:hypothetical protein
MTLIYFQSRMLSITFNFDGRQGLGIGAGVANPRVFTSVLSIAPSAVEAQNAELVAKYRPAFKQLNKDAHTHRIGPEYAVGQFDLIQTSQTATATAIVATEGFLGNVRVIETYELLGPPDNVRVAP